MTTDLPMNEDDEELSFDKRWESLRHKNKVNLYQTQRPPGWEDIKCWYPRVKNDKISSLCPSVVIQDPCRAWPVTSVRHKLPAPPVSGRCREASQCINRSSPNKRELSRQLHHDFSDNFLQFPIQEVSSSCTQESESVSTSVGKQLPQFSCDMTQQPSPTLDVEQSPSTSDVHPQHLSNAHASHKCSSTTNVIRHPDVISRNINKSDLTLDDTRHICTRPHENQLCFNVKQTQHSFSTYASHHSLTSDMTRHVCSSLNQLQHPASKSMVSQKYSFTSDAIPSAGSQSPTSTTPQQCPLICSASQELSPMCKDHHMWISSDSFLCEDFTFTDFNHLENEPKEHHETAAEPQWDTSRHCELQTPVSVNGGKFHGISRKGEEKGIAVPATESPSRLICGSRLSTTPSDLSVNRKASTVRMADLPQHQHWIKFENIQAERQTPEPEELWEKVSTIPTLNDDSKPGEIFPQPTPSGSLPRVAALVKHKSIPTNAGSYSGRLIRTYSQRGHRASKRVIGSVSRRMSASEYGRLPESLPPMYSKAAMTMQSGPGLFEETPKRVESSECPREEEKQSHSEKSQAKVSIPSLQEENRPRRVGSIRLPRMPRVSLRRSASVSAPLEQSKDVPFQRLTDQRPGSFRRALGALARSFRKKSNGTTKPSAADNQTTSIPRDIDDPLINGKQTPQAPKLPRKATKHTCVTTQTGNPKVSFV